MQNAHDDTDSLSDFRSNTPEFVRRLKETGRPIVLTIDGRAELVVQDSESYRRLIESVERADRLEALRASVEDMKAGRVTPAEEMLAEMREILAEKQGR